MISTRGLRGPSKVSCTTATAHHREIASFNELLTRLECYEGVLAEASLFRLIDSSALRRRCSPCTARARCPGPPGAIPNCGVFERPLAPARQKN